MADETLFHPDRYKLKNWMRREDPIMKTTRFSPIMPKINLCCVISPILGNIYNKYSE